MKLDVDIRNSPSVGAPIAGVVVSFEPDQQFRTRLQALIPQVDMTIVVDNSLGEDVSGSVSKICDDLNCTCVINGRNLGVAEALNQGIEVAMAAGAAYVITMDQDSTPETRMVLELRTVMAHGMRGGVSIGIVAPTTVDRFQALPPPRNACACWTEADLVITSGALIPIQVFKSAGLFRRDFFIDSVDQEFCLRIRRHGYRIIRAHEAMLNHRLGAPTVHRLLGMRFIPTNHSASRRFFMARNVIWVTRLFFFTYSATVAGLLVKLLKNAVLIAAFEDKKLTKLGAVARGIVQGIRTRPMPIQTLR